MLNKQQLSMLYGILLIVLFSLVAFFIGGMHWAKSVSISPMIIGIVIGMIYANTLRSNLPQTWVPGITFCAKRVLRVGIVLYGFRLTLQDVTAVGLPAIAVDAIVVCVTIVGGLLIGRILKLDRSMRASVERPPCLEPKAPSMPNPIKRRWLCLRLLSSAHSPCFSILCSIAMVYSTSRPSRWAL